MSITRTLGLFLVASLFTAQTLHANVLTEFFARRNDPHKMRLLSLIGAVGTSAWFIGRSYYRSPQRIKNKYKTPSLAERQKAVETLLIPNYALHDRGTRYRTRSVFREARKKVTADIAILKKQTESTEAIKVKAELEALRNLFDETLIRLYEIDYGPIFNVLETNDDESKKLLDLNKAVLRLIDGYYPYAAAELEVADVIVILNSLISELKRTSNNPTLLESAEKMVKQCVTLREQLHLTLEFRRETGEIKREVTQNHNDLIAATEFFAVAVALSVIVLSHIDLSLRLSRIHSDILRNEIR